MMRHLTMPELLALRDDDRSEPGMASAREHFAECPLCQDELDRLHQRTARLRALPTLSPGSNEFPAVRARVTADRHQRQWQTVATGGLAIAAALVVSVITRDLVHPARLDAAEQLQAEMSRSQLLELKLHALHPDARVMDGRTVMVVVQLENRIASLDAQLAQAAQSPRGVRANDELKLWQQRVGLMNALVDVHMSGTGNVGL